MSGWVLVEEKESNGKAFVGVMNLANVLELDAGTDALGRVIVEVYSPTGANVSTLELKDWTEFQKFLLLLPGVDSLGWLHVKDGRVLGAWRGELDVSELTKDEAGRGQK